MESTEEREGTYSLKKNKACQTWQAFYDHQLFNVHESKRIAIDICRHNTFPFQRLRSFPVDPAACFLP